ncbi:MAG TPA: efflux RND transporter periplasmic adaptor subunit [Terracidiphilus sp.]|jgi:multidrug efflux system membrane fusion protein
MDKQSSVSHVPPASQPASDSPAPVKRRRHWWVWVVVLLGFGLTFYWVTTHQQHSQAATGRGGGGRRGMGGVVPVTMATAHSGSVGIYQDAIGTVTPIYTVSMTAQVTGVITAVHYREGQMVKKGDPLIDIDSRQYEAQLEQAEGTLERDRNLLAQAEMDVERYKVAWAKNAIPRQTFEDQEKLVAQTKGTIKNDEGIVAYDKVQIGYCHLTSPINGRVGLRLVDAGNLVTANSTTTLVVVTEIQPITVIFTLAEDALPSVVQQTRHGQQLKVEALDRSQQGHLATGRLTSIDNQIDTTTGTVKLRAEFDNRDAMLFPNQFVNTRLLVKTLQNQTLIPSSAIQHNGSQDFVYVIEENKASVRTVKVGNSDKGETAVVQGLKPGEVVADSSFEKLQNGSEISESKIKLPSASSDTTGSPAQ